MEENGRSLSLYIYLFIYYSHELILHGWPFAISVLAFLGIAWPAAGVNHRSTKTPLSLIFPRPTQLPITPSCHFSLKISYFSLIPTSYFSSLHTDRARKGNTTKQYSFLPTHTTSEERKLVIIHYIQILVFFCLVHFHLIYNFGKRENGKKLE